SKASQNYQVVLADIWLKALTKVALEFSYSQLEDENSRDWRQFYKYGVRLLIKNLTEDYAQKM
ncbi:hypothetical protein, partial [Trichormus azollae]|uniref:hypothetical protein n=1 Tax=Trichormus azollae TaxID=1164 RepID=UPI00325E5ED6